MLKWILLAAVAMAGIGCADDQPSTMRQRQESAMKDPWTYSPWRDDDRSVGSGGMADFDSKAFKRDVNSVFGN